MLSILYSLYSNNSVSHTDTWNYLCSHAVCPYNIVYILITVCHIEILGITSVFVLCCPYNIVYILITVCHIEIVEITSVFMQSCPYNIVYILITVCHIEILEITSVFMLC